MNKKVKIITGWLAVAVFLFALVINVKITMNDPFVSVGETLLATGTSTTGTGTVQCQYIMDAYSYQYCSGETKLLEWWQDLECERNYTAQSCYSGLSVVRYDCSGFSTIVQNNISSDSCMY